MKRFFLFSLTLVTFSTIIGLTTLQAADTPEQASETLQDAWFAGDATAVRQQIEVLEKLAKSEPDATTQARAHYFAGLGWRNYASLTEERIEAYHSAVAHFEKAIELVPEQPEYHALLSHVVRSLIGSGQRDHDTIQKAIFHREKAYELAPNNPRVLMMDAFALISIPEGRGGNVDSGVATAFEAAGRFEMEPTDNTNIGPAQNWALIGMGFNKMGDHQSALKAYRKALEEKPNWKSIRDTIVPAIEQQNRTDRLKLAK